MKTVQIDQDLTKFCLKGIRRQLEAIAESVIMIVYCLGDIVFSCCRLMFLLPLLLFQGFLFVATRAHEALAPRKPSHLSTPPPK